MASRMKLVGTVRAMLRQQKIMQSGTMLTMTQTTASTVYSFIQSSSSGYSFVVEMQATTQSSCMERMP